MEWFYVTNGQRNGPISRTELGALYGRGEIDASTLVWREGMSDWGPFGRVMQEIPPDQASARIGVPPPVQPDASTEAGAESDIRVCSGCDGRFPADRLTPRGDQLFCRNCDPATPVRPVTISVSPSASGSPLAIAGIVLGVFGLFIPCCLPLSIAGLACSLIAYNRNTREGLPQGVAMAGIIVSAIALLVNLGVIPLIFITQ